MKSITANRLVDGIVVYWTVDLGWSPRLSEAACFSNSDAEAALAEASRDIRHIAEPYLIERADDGGLAGRDALRETLRTRGPSVRPDLGYQAAL